MSARLVIEAVTLKRSWAYRAPESKLHYDGVDFQRVAIFDDQRHIGEIEVQIGKSEVVVRNAIIYNQADTGRGIGQAAYQGLAALFPCKTIRSSDGFSDQAARMWGALERKGLAAKSDQHYRLARRSVEEALRIRVPPFAQKAFFVDHGAPEEFWAFRGRPSVKAGDAIEFAFGPKPVARAVVSRVEPPGSSACGHSGKFGDKWKVHWRDASFKRLPSHGDADG